MKRTIVGCIVAAALAAAGIAHANAVTGQTADRMEGGFIYLGGDPEPPPTARVVCNMATYYAYDNGVDSPAAKCYRAVAAEEGWSAQKIAAWQPFLITEFSGVIQGEASSCWNLRGGDRIAAGEPCTAVRRTSSPGDDTGWGQATRSLWGSNAHLCLAFGVCHWSQIISDPHSSMLNSVIRVVDYNGSQPWCFAGWAITYHQCWEAPDR